MSGKTDEKKHICPLAVKQTKRNPSTPPVYICPFLEKMAEYGTDIKWLKKGYWVQVIFGFGTFLGVIGLALRFLNLIPF